MNAALLLLMRLQCRAWGRSAFRALKTIKGFLLALVGFGVVAAWLTATALTPREGRSIDPDTLRRNGPAAILAYCVLTVLLSRGERAIYFNPAEVNFLFAGPFTRRRLLLYKIASSALVGLPTSLFLTFLVRIHASWFLAAYLGLFLIFLFLQLFAMVIGLMAITLGAHVYTRGRKLLVLAIGLGVAAILFHASRNARQGGLVGVFELLEDSPVWQFLTAPLGCFIETFLVEQYQWLDLAKWGGLSLTVTAVCIVAVMLLDAQYLESAAAVSERLHAQIRKMRRGEAVALDWKGSGSATWGLPTFPYWGGAGPIAWRQATTAIRSLGRLALVVLILMPVMVGPLFAGRNEESPAQAVAVVGGLLVWLTMLLTTIVPFDFRSDLDRMEVLKTLPVSPWVLVLGQLLTPVLILLLLQTLCLLAFWPALGLETREVFWGVLFSLPLDLMMFGLDNLLFLWFPTRVFALNPGDFQALGRNVVMLLTKSIVLALAGGAGLGLGLLTWWLTDYHADAALLVGWLTLSIFAATLVPLTGWAFRTFDVSRDRAV